ncbi:uncharacterized protein H6S33_008829, partial [Morchella sextelata]|uniref:uncharacterized protein n=1 Tax=Morchella sextelata TaxID=1174677 RepID=UPI001D0530FE
MWKGNRPIRDNLFKYKRTLTGGFYDGSVETSARAERALGCVSPAPQGDAVKYLSHHLDVLAQDYTEEEVWEAAI